MTQDGRTDWLQAEIDNLKAAGLYNHIRTIDSVSYTHLTLPTNREV